MDILSEKQIFSNQVFHVKTCHVKDDCLNEVKDYLIVEPKVHDADYTSGVAIMAVVDNKIACVNIYRPALKKKMIEIPHGFIKQGESLEEACSRELEEETGIIALPSAFKFLCAVAPDGGVIRAYVKLFFVSAEAPKKQVVPELGLGEVIYLNKDKLMAGIKTGEICDSFTIVALYSAIAEGYLE